MPASYLVVLSSTTLSDGDVMDPATALDLACYRTLDLVVRVEEAGSGDAPKLVVEHSASNAADTWLGFTEPVEVDLTATGIAWSRQEAFTRWVGWRISGSLSASAVVTLEIVARE